MSSNGGKTFALNVIPTEAEAGFDIRITPNHNLGEMKQMLSQWAKEAHEEHGGSNKDDGDCSVTWKFAPWTQPLFSHFVTSMDKSENPWFEVFHDSILANSSVTAIVPEIFPAATDSRFVRELGIPAFG